MQVADWIAEVSRGGKVCGGYMRKISLASGRGEMFRVLCDANGGSWVFGLHASGMYVPVSEFAEEYARYINGGRVVEYPEGYTSKFYCRYSGALSADTTLVYVMESDVSVEVPENRFPTVFLSSGSRARFAIGNNARLVIEAYGNAWFDVSGDTRHVSVRRYGEWER